MVITFLQKRKLEQRLILVFIAILLIVSLVLWLGFRKKQEPTGQIFVPRREVKINFLALENPLLDELESFEKFPLFEAEPGRENPFLSY